eukprot:Plantae.Rhodophyta-Rhodochaete_pulchella.ctg57655.p1 GENE.Plantae.Rhodophyta-Rhodochaete_pulchella.ctg57655~~Plantae.Rhodophyta-Rhodochaete_pulchella.ctg57655.p1  ORF type:complete len:386 (+),score=-5.87 Plantae.Rhodophyta-Rhodochaete_pulchella.ctg57655:911-2068(+)
MSNPSSRSKTFGELGPKLFSLKEKTVPIESIIKASYLRVFGRAIYEEEQAGFKKLEQQLRENSISVKDFISSLAKSDVFRKLYWQPFYICKAIEYIHTRLLGRPTYGRQEINKYFNIVYKENYYNFIDSIVNSAEYMESFGTTTVPYERYITPSGLALRTLRPNTVNQTLAKVEKRFTDRFIELGSITEIRSEKNISLRIKQGVTNLRSQQIIFKLNNLSSLEDREQIIKAAYIQIFERDINAFCLGNELINAEAAFLNKEITTQDLIRAIGCSKLYKKEFYQPYPNTKVIELGTKHFLGRAPNNQAEIRYYNQILASKGLDAFLNTLINSEEYNSLFGNTIVPYRRFPTLPACNFHNTEKLYNNLTKQNNLIVIPSTKAIPGNQ